MVKQYMTILACGLLLAGAAQAKLVAPTLTPEQKEKAAEAAARTAWSGKVADYQLCKSMDRVAAHYQSDMKRRGSTPPALDPAPPACADPGPFVAPGAAAAAPAPAVAATAAKPAAAKPATPVKK